MMMNSLGLGPDNCPKDVLIFEKIQDSDIQVVEMIITRSRNKGQSTEKGRGEETEWNGGSQVSRVRVKIFALSKVSESNFSSLYCRVWENKEQVFLVRIKRL